MNKKNDNYSIIEPHVISQLRALPKGKNAKLHELTEHVVSKVLKMRQADAYDLVGRLLMKLKRAKKVKYVGGRGCGWRMA